MTSSSGLVISSLPEIDHVLELAAAKPNADGKTS